MCTYRCKVVCVRVGCIGSYINGGALTDLHGRLLTELADVLCYMNNVYCIRYGLDSTRLHNMKTSTHLCYYFEILNPWFYMILYYTYITIKDVSFIINNMEYLPILRGSLLVPTDPDLSLESEKEEGKEFSCLCHTTGTVVYIAC